VLGLLATRTLLWTEIVREHTAWDVFLWFGGIIRMGEALNEFKVTEAFATAASGWFGGWTWPVLFLAIALLYFYVHYFFASVTTHIVSMFLPFASLLVAAGAPAALAVFGLAVLANLAACLTHYGTVPGPILYSQGYVSTGRWWKVGAIMSVGHSRCGERSGSRGGRCWGCGDRRLRSGGAVRRNVSPGEPATPQLSPPEARMTNAPDVLLRLSHLEQLVRD
jgi:hypothetical protein